MKNSSHTVLDSATYGYNAGHQRTTFTNAAGTYLGYTYDKIGQLKVADSSVNPEDRGYQYDTAWNLNYRTNNGVLATFQVDNRNELTNAYGGANGFDSNGNLVSGTDGHTIYVYDDENRLIQWFSYLVSSNSLSGGDLRTDFTYDGQGRLRKRLEYSYNSGGASAVFGGLIQPLVVGSWTLLSETRYIYDGMRVIQERDGNNTPLVSYTRGTDLSGSLEGAVGIGGLLARSHGYASTNGNWYTHNFYHADGNGNVTYLVNSSQTLAASYRYDPFGNTTASSGTLAAANVYRFSSKEVKGSLLTFDTNPAKLCRSTVSEIIRRFGALNRAAMMVGAAGTTSYGYAAGGQLWTEDGPWASDTVTNNYSNRLRTSLSLAQPTDIRGI